MRLRRRADPAVGAAEQAGPGLRGDSGRDPGEEALTPRNARPPAGVTAANADSGGGLQAATTVFNSRSRPN